MSNTPNTAGSLLEVRAALFDLDVHFMHPTKGIEAVQRLVALKEERSPRLSERTVALINELAWAVDGAAEDVGGYRSHRAIFNDLKQEVARSLCEKPEGVE